MILHVIYIYNKMNIPLPNQLNIILFEYLRADDAFKYIYLTTGKWFCPEVLNKIFAKRIRRYLYLRYNLDEEFLQAWHNTNRDSELFTMLSGSTILQAILGLTREEWWSESDMDMYALNNRKRSRQNYSAVPFSPLTNYLWERNVAIYGEHELKKFWSSDNYCHLRSIGISTVRSWKLSKTQKFQFLYLDTTEQGRLACRSWVQEEKFINTPPTIDWVKTEIQDWVHDRYDFTFLCNTFDGINCQIDYPESIAMYKHLPGRIYRKKRNNFWFNNKELREIEYTATRRVQRLEKYKLRGFDIPCNFEEMEKLATEST
jgi:hypothetical protein